MSPQLDVSDAILDPEFADVVNVTRRPYTIDPTSGIVVAAPYQVSPEPIGVITQGDRSPIQQAADAQNAKAVITVHVYQFQLYDVESLATTKQQFQPDLITYNGNIYIVDRLLNWSQYGQGFTQASASLYQMTDTGQ